jgi:hypothetical protein
VRVEAEKEAAAIAASSAAVVRAHRRAIAPKSTAPSFAITSHSFSTHPWYLTSQGEGAFGDSATAAMCGTSPEFEATMLGVARTLPILTFFLL